MRLLAFISALVLLAGASADLLATQRGGNRQREKYGAGKAFSSSGDNTEKSEYSWSRLRYSMARGGAGGYVAEWRGLRDDRERF